MIAAGLGAMVLAAASVYAVTSDEPTGSSPDSAGDGAQATGGRTTQPESASEGDADRGLPLIAGLRAGPAALRPDAPAGDQAASSGGDVPADASLAPGAAPVDGSKPMTPPPPGTGEPPTTPTTSTTAPTTTTTTLPLGGIGDLIGGLLAVPTLG